jgi:hypothetical protein
MQAVESIETISVQSNSVEFVQELQTSLDILCFIFIKSLLDFQHIDVKLDTKRITTVQSKEFDRQFALFIAQIVSKGWDRYIESQAKEAEITKAAVKKDRQKKDEINYLNFMNSCKKTEIQKQETVHKVAI